MRTSPNGQLGSRIERASRCYDETKYPEQIYLHCLDLLKRPGIENSTALKPAVTALFQWKYGKVRLRPTANSTKKQLDGSGLTFYVSGGTGSQEAVVDRALDVERVDHAVAFRDGQESLGQFRPWADGITSCKQSVVSPCFYVHIWRPDDYPMIDRYVWRAYLAMTDQSHNRSQQPHSWRDYRDYVRFFNKLRSETGLDARTLDRGLWVLGSRV